MFRYMINLYLLIFVFFVKISAINTVNNKSGFLNPKKAQDIGMQAYIYGYSIITSEVTRVQMTNVPQVQGLKGPMGHFINAREYPPANFRGVTAPNADTLYSLVWIDLDNEPWIFSHPNMGDRYFLFPMYDLWTTVIDSPGQRTTGGDAATYMLIGPKWKGKLPLIPGQRITKYIHSSTRYMFILGRTYCTGTTEDYTAVHKLQYKYLLRPLSVDINNSKSTFDTYIPMIPKVNSNPGFSMTDKVRDVVNNMNISTYFNMLTEIMKDNSLLKRDRHIIKKMTKLGLVPGQMFDLTKFDKDIQIAFNQVPKIAFNKISSLQHKSGIVQNGWVIPKAAGRYGTDYLQRAVIAAYGWGANLPDDAIYPYTTVDSNGHKLSGKNKYTIRFLKDQTPPVNGFWSITMYDLEYFFVPNSLNKFTLSPRDSLIYNAKDGSLDLYFQHRSPGIGKENNWLPAPKGDFILMLRMYWPEDTHFAINNKSWSIPSVRQVV